MDKNLPYDELLKQVRKKTQEKQSGARDPDEFRVPKARPKERMEYLMKVLPELTKGDTCKGGVSPESMDLWYYQNGAHFFDNKMHPCPRVHDGEECPLCLVGFELLNETDDEDQRKRIARIYLPRTYFGVNVYILNHKNNPEELRGQVRWYNLQKTVWGKMDACLQNDDEGDPKTNPKAAGIFWHPWERTYVFNLIAFKKGDWNNYDESAFLPLTKGPLAALKDGSSDDKRIQAILDQRIYIPERFPARNPEKLKQIANTLLKKGPTDEGSGGEADEVVGEGEVKTKSSQVVVEEDVVSETPSDEVATESTPAKTTTKAKSAAAEEPAADQAETATATAEDAADPVEGSDEELSDILKQINSKK